MRRRDILAAALGAGVGLALPASAATTGDAPDSPIARAGHGKIRVAFAISPRANVIDMSGPWETFQDVMLPSGDMPFELYTFAETMDVVEMTGGLRLQPMYSFETMPRPNVIVVGAQSNRSPHFMQLLRDAQGKVDVTMSVCTGAFKLGESGILDGKSATTHHDYYDAFAKQFPNVHLVRGTRFVDNGSIVTAGGLTSGISAALHVISRYFDPQTAASTAAYMEFTPTRREA
jgi:transcriptional regulator GlxA family with amidase domain